MARNYQRTKNNPYYLPHNVYMRTLYLVKDYKRMTEEWENMLEASNRPIGGIRGSGHGDDTAYRAERRMNLEEKIKAVEQAVYELPTEYGVHIMENIAAGKALPIWLASDRTWKIWRARYLYFVAKHLKEI